MKKNLSHSILLVASYISMNPYETSYVNKPQTYKHSTVEYFLCGSPANHSLHRRNIPSPGTKAYGPMVDLTDFFGAFSAKQGF